MIVFGRPLLVPIFKHTTHYWHMAHVRFLAERSWYCLQKCDMSCYCLRQTTGLFVLIMAVAIVMDTS